MSERVVVPPALPIAEGDLVSRSYGVSACTRSLSTGWWGGMGR
jgi:hypothetical protein